MSKDLDLRHAILWNLYKLVLAGPAKPHTPVRHGSDYKKQCSIHTPQAEVSCAEAANGQSFASGLHLRRIGLRRWTSVFGYRLRLRSAQL
jgi:hypothetical protein